MPLKDLVPSPVTKNDELVSHVWWFSEVKKALTSEPTWVPSLTGDVFQRWLTRGRCPSGWVVIPPPMPASLLTQFSKPPPPDVKFTSGSQQLDESIRRFTGEGGQEQHLLLLLHPPVFPDCPRSSCTALTRICVAEYTPLSLTLSLSLKLSQR